MINLTFFSFLFAFIHHQFLNNGLDMGLFRSRSYVKASTCLCNNFPSRYSLDLYSIPSGIFFSFVKRKWLQLIHISTGVASLLLSQYSSSCIRWYMAPCEWYCLLPQQPGHHNHIHAQRLANLENSLFT